MVGSDLSQSSSEILYQLNMLRILYTLSIKLYIAVIAFAALFNDKASKWIKGRKNLIRDLQDKFNEDDRPVWFHCASLGEFEQGRPLIEEIKKQMPEKKILLTFYSPSGYEIRKNYNLADHVCYLPYDTPNRTHDFIQAVNPEMVFIVKYEFWFNLLDQLKSAHIPVYLIAGIFRKEQSFFRSWGKWFLKHLKSFEWFFLQDKASRELLLENGFENTSISGDTRLDRVWNVAQQAEDIPGLKEFCGESKILVAGSSWPADEEHLKNLIKSDTGLKFIFAPHEVHESHIQSLISLLDEEVIRYSAFEQEFSTDKRILIIDSIGMLNRIYKYADIAYIGGGFGKGIHNILEASTFGVPVIFGPRYQIFKEARDLVADTGAYVVNDSDELISTVNSLLQDNEQYTRSAEVSRDYVASNKGATSHIFETVF